MKTRTRRKSKQKHKSEIDTNCALCAVVIVIVASAMLREFCRRAVERVNVCTFSLCVRLYILHMKQDSVNIANENDSGV